MVVLKKLFWLGQVFTYFGIVLISTQSKADEYPKFELLHLWAETAEKYALRAFSDPMEAQGVEWSEHIVRTNFAGVRSQYAERLAYAVPPTATFWIGGGDIATGMIESGVFRAIPQHVGNVDLSNALKPEIYDAIDLDDGLSVLPLGIHLQNYVVYNRQILTEIGVSEIESWEDFLLAAQKAHQQGYVALSISDQTWQLRFLAGSILVEYLSANDLKELSKANTITLEQYEALLKLFGLLDRLRPYINTDYEDLNWATSLKHVTSGRAMANILGDFVTPLLPNGNEIACGLPPGNHYVTWSFDSVALTNTDEPTEIAGQNLFIDNVINPENYLQYISRKGGVPVFNDVDTNTLLPCAQASIHVWDTATEHVLLSTDDWTRSLQIIADASRVFLANPEQDLRQTVDDLIVTLRSLGGGANIEGENPW